MKLISIIISFACVALSTAFTPQPCKSALLQIKRNIVQQCDDARFHLLHKATASNHNEDLQVGIDKAWRHAPKPLLRIGGKGVANSHGNSLRELLNAHTVVKVKINSTKLGSLEDVFETLKALVGQSEGFAGVELIHVRNSENTIMIGKEGTMDNIRDGTFPPPPESKTDNDDGLN